MSPQVDNAGVKLACCGVVLLAAVVAGCGAGSQHTVHTVKGRYTVQQVEQVFHDKGFTAPTVRRFHGDVVLQYRLARSGRKGTRWLWARIQPRIPAGTFQPARRFQMARRRNVWIYYISPRAQAQVKTLLTEFK